MCELIKNDIFIIFSDNYHDHPMGILLLPLASHCMPLVNLDLQFNMTEDLKEILWTLVSSISKVT